MAFSIYTAEMRWFLPGGVPGNIVDHLERLPGKLEKQPERTDVYFLMNGLPNLGIKLREGRIELKKRTAVHDVFSSGEKTGQVESWLKWSIQATGAMNPFQAMFQNPKHWVNIRKTRTLVKFGINPDGIVTLPPEDGYPENGIAIEASVLEIKQTSWWTLGLECFGAPEKVYSNLLTIAPEIFVNLKAKECSLTNSFGYPEWILRIINP
jgi:hypothetical protein